MDDLIASAGRMPSLFSLERKTAVVTGAAGGLGRGIAAALAGAGANVALLDISAEKLAPLAETIVREYGHRADGFSVDVTDECQVASTMQAIGNDYESIDILVNCAGVAVLGPALEMKLEDWRRGMQINLEGTFICCREAGRFMTADRRGKIVNISSVRGLQGRSGYTSYAPSKAGVNLLTKSLACEWAEFGVNVNAIAPIFIRTEMNAHIVDDPVKGNAILARIPMGRLGRVEDLFGAVVYLASPASDFVTGTVLYVDGGWTAA
jgi:NAD(P)-dependent dehydrogenase (short-subunit alcohol dehydrogenase family)